MVIIGIDPGLNGAVTVISDYLAVYESFDMPTRNIKDWNGKTTHKEIDPFELNTRLGRFRGDSPIVVIEKVHGIPGGSSAATFSFGRAFQAAISAVEGWQMQYELVPPQTWQKHFFTDEFKPKLKDKDRVDVKARSLHAVKQIWKSDVIEKHFCHYRPKAQRLDVMDGRVDAALLAYWGLKHIAEAGKHKFVDIKPNKPIFKKDLCPEI